MSSFEQLRQTLHDIGVLKSARAILAWDQETYMPRGGAELRANQLALLSGIIHRRVADPALGEMLSATAAKANGDPDVAAIVRESTRDHERATKVPAELVEERARVTTLARGHWAEARTENDFAKFLPWLEQVVGVSRRIAEARGYDESPYDALLDDYEAGATASQLNEIFPPLREALTDLLGRILDSGVDVDDSCLRRTYAPDLQAQFSRMVAQKIGFDFQRGRLDLTVHPFCSGTGPGDVRITTRYDKNAFDDGLFSVLHETGHGMYEQGLDPRHFGTPLGESCSLGIHESQSRMWENLVARSRGFWKHFYPKAQNLFPHGLGDTSLDEFHRAINRVSPSLIRVDADEVTYNLHVFLRFELEQAMLTGELDCKDLPEAWAQKFETAFRIRPPSDTKGCLQDIHWSAGLYGYFPTYTLGNVYAAQLFDKAEEDLGELEPQFQRGDFRPLKDWLQKNIHREGRRYAPRDLIKKVTGKEPSQEPLIRRLTEKYGAVYGL